MENFWEQAAQDDPLWAILSDPTKRGRQWELSAFFKTGRREISLLLHQLKQLGHVPRPGRALDFGCGVGRLTQALAKSFERVVGIDVSPTMIRLAERLNQHPGNASYLLNTAPTLAQLATATFDFVYSDIVLQHLEPEAAQTYVAEFLRLLSPGGIAVFQLPSHRRSLAEQPPRPVDMPAGAYRAQLRILQGLPEQWLPGQSAVLTLEVQNHSSVTWDQRATGTIRLGNHWRSTGDEMLIQDDGRASIPGVLEGAASARLLLPVQAPSEPGAYICECDLVHEGISWFGDRGSQTIRIPVHVSSAAGGDDTGDMQGHGETALESEFPEIYPMLRPQGEVDLPPFPMNGVPHLTVMELVRRHGGEVFLAENDERGGPEWQGYRYFVRKH